MQFGIRKVCAMTKSIRNILTPFLIISYVLGLRIAGLSKSYLKLWFSLGYISLVWSIYYFIFTSIITSFNKFNSIDYRLCYSLELLTTILSIVFSVYYDKKFQNCLKKLNIMDNTLFKLGIITDYDKLRKKTVRVILGWSMIVILMNCIGALVIRSEYNCNIAKAMLLIFIQNYCFHINFISDLTTASILEYIELKFDQINEHLQNLTKYNRNKIIQVWENLVTYPQECKFSKAIKSKYMTWTVVHLHLELRKICGEIDSIFGKQMSFKMASYFIWLAMDLREFLYLILINDYMKFRIMFAIVYLLWTAHNVFKFLLINCMCETVTTKASVTANLLNRLSYFTCDDEIREIILQFSLRTIYAPFKFCGIGLFQFGFKFLHSFIASIATVSIIIIQAQANK